MVFMRAKTTKDLGLNQKRLNSNAFRRNIASGSAIFSNRVWDELARNLRFTKRELQIMRGVFDDQTEYAIGADLGISIHTVHTHLERLRHKLGAVDRAALILRVIEEFLSLTRA